jgi:trans-aconitate 2-methyltransferase
MSWDPTLYDAKHAFVAAFGEAVIAWLNPQPGELIIDLGCGTGHLTAQLAAAGATPIGLDSSAAMIAEARRQFPQLDFREADARSFTAERPVDAVFSNAALHWVRPPEAAVERIARALRSGGRFVAEFGGRGNTGRIERELIELTGAESPWYFPSVAEYAVILEQQGLEVRQAALFDRPTRLEDGPAGLRNWLAMFGDTFFRGLDATEREAIVTEIERRLRAELWREDAWWVEYRRLRIEAVKANEKFKTKSVN